MCCEILGLYEWLRIRVKEADSEFSRCVAEHRLKEYEELVKENYNLKKENEILKTKAEAFDIGYSKEWCEENILPYDNYDEYVCKATHDETLVEENEFYIIKKALGVK